MMVNKNLLFVTLSVIFILMAFVGTVTAQREYHLEHEWAKTWINQNGSIDLLYDISITLDSGPSINYVYLGQPKRDFTIGTVVDQYGHTLVASDASSGSDYKVKVNLYEPLMAGQTVRFNLTTNVARMIYEDTQNPGNVSMTFIPTWWEEASVLDLQVQIVLPPGVTVDMVIATEELWSGTFPEDGRLSVFWQRANLSPNQKYTFGVSFPKEFIQEYTSGIYILPDGSIDPPTANISTVDYITYTFIGDIYDSIVIEKDNIVVDGAGYILQGIGSGTGIDLSDRSNVTIKNTEIKQFGFGIYLNHSSSNSIVDNHFISIAFECIRLYESSNNTIATNNLILNDIDGITLYGSANNNITKNYLMSNYDGIRLYESSNNSITENIVIENYYGISLASSCGNNIVNNNVTANHGTGISLVRSSNENRIAKNHIASNNFRGMRLNESSNNVIYHNNFVDNTEQVHNINSTNVWDDGYPSGGNYWSNYVDADQYSGPYQNETGSDGIWDHPYVIDENNQDNYPIIQEFPSLIILQLFMATTLLAVIIIRRKHRADLKVLA